MIKVLQLISIEYVGGASSLVLTLRARLDYTKFHFDYLSLFVDDNHQSVRQKIESHGEHIIKFPSPKYRLRQYRKIYEKLENFILIEKYDIIHIHAQPELNFAYNALCSIGQKHHIPVLLHCHSTNPLPIKWFYIKSRLLYWFFNWRYPITGELRLACSELASRAFWGAPSAKLVRNGIDTGLFQFSEEKRKQIRKTLEISSDDFVIGTIGRMDKNKNQTFLIDVFVELIKLKPKSKLLLVGDGATRLGLEQKVKDLKLKNLVIFTGTRTDVPALYSAMDIFCLPSFFEGLPVVGIESQCSGLPLIMSDSISKESAILDSTIFLPLRAGQKKWAEEIVLLSKAKKLKRTNCANILQQKGWDISDTVKQLENIYKNR